MRLVPPVPSRPVPSPLRQTRTRPASHNTYVGRLDFSTFISVFTHPPTDPLTPHSNFKPPVTASTRLLGAGPTPSTVRLPGSICVRPASWITSAVMPRLRAFPISSSSSSSDFVCTAILAWPWRSQRWRRAREVVDVDAEEEIVL